MRNAIVDKILMDRMNRREGYNMRDYEDGYGRDGYSRDGRRGGRGRRNDYGRGNDYGYEEDEDEKYLREMQDGRRGVKGTGRGRRRSYRRDRGEELMLSKSDMMNWKRNLENADGTSGPHFTMEELMKAAKEVGVRFEDYDERELCMTANMLYSDYCEKTKPYVSPERECHFYVELAQAFLEDEDGPEPSEKLALYYYCIAEDD